MTNLEALEWFERRQNMHLDDKCQEAEDRAIQAIKDCIKYRKAAKRFKRKWLNLEFGIRRTIDEMADLTSDAYGDYQLGFNYGVMKSYKILKRNITQ